MMLDIQSGKANAQTVGGAVYRVVAESSSAFQEDIQAKLEEKKAVEAQRLRDLAQAEVVVAVDKKALSAASSVSTSTSKAPVVDTPPARGGTFDLNA